MLQKSSKVFKSILIMTAFISSFYSATWASELEISEIVISKHAVQNKSEQEVLLVVLQRAWQIGMSVNPDSLFQVGDRYFIEGIRNINYNIDVAISFSRDLSDEEKSSAVLNLSRSLWRIKANLNVDEPFVYLGIEGLYSIKVGVSSDTPQALSKLTSELIASGLNVRSAENSSGKITINVYLENTELVKAASICLDIFK